MQSVVRVWIDGQGLHDIDPKIVVLDVAESTPALSISTGANGKYDGGYIIANNREQKDVTIQFAILERKFERRAELLDKVNAWAEGDLLRVSYRPGQALECVCTAFPAVNSAWQYAETLQITFTAYGIPYWQQRDRTAVRGDASTDQSLGIRVPGTVKQCRATIEATNTSGAALTSLKATCAETNTEIELTGLNIGSGKTLTIGYDVHGYMYIKDSDGTSWYGKRTAKSSDDVLLNTKQGNNVRIQANTPVTSIVSAKGLFL